MNAEVLAAVADRMNRLDEVGVTWDRCVLHDGSGVVYGWIGREDDRADFVVIEVQYGETRGLDESPVPWLVIGTHTSSAKHSARISELLLGADAGHKDCERVADVFGGLVNCKVSV